MIALSLILVSAILHAVVNVATKYVADKYAMRLLIGVFSVVLTFPALFFVPLPGGPVLWLLAATAFVHAFYEYLMVRSYESAAFSAVYPIARGTAPLFTALGAIAFLHEPVSAWEGIGIVCVCSGVIAIGHAHRTHDGAFAGILFALGTGVTVGAYTLIDASGVRAVENPLTYVPWFFVAHAVAVCCTAPGLRGRAVIVAARAQWKLGAVVAALSVFSYGAALLAFRFGATAELSALRQTSVLFGTALAMAFLGEKLTLRMWLAAGVIVAGAILLQIH